MIKYLELTAPEQSEFRQAKIVSILVSEGDAVNAGEALFRVLSGSNEVDLPSSLDGRVIEIIVDEGENISLMTPLVLLETEVEKSTATPPISQDDESEGSLQQAAEDEANAPSAVNNEAQEIKKAKKTKAKKAKKAKKKNKQAKNAKKNAKQAKAEVQQQTLNLGDETLDVVAEVDAQTTQRETKHSNIKQPAANASSNMSDSKITVPDIGIESAKVIEILVSVGDQVALDDALVTLESDKASMDVPSTAAGTITSIDVELEQDVAEGDVILTLDVTQADSSEPLGEPSGKAANDATEPAQATASDTDNGAEPAPADADAASTTESVVEVKIPDIGGDAAKVIEIFVEAGQSVAVEDPLVTLESDKASMDVPSPVAGVIDSIAVNIDDEVSEGNLVAKVLTADSTASQNQTTTSTETSAAPAPAPSSAPAPAAPKPSAAAPTSKSAAGSSHASPSVRRFARELGADLSKISGTGRKNRVTEDDVKKFVKGIVTAGGSAGGTATNGAGIEPIPAVDFSKFGEVDVQPLNKIKKLTAANLTRSWLNVPHVTHNDESNISDLESFRKQLNDEYAKQGKDIKLSPLAFIVKAVVNAMQTYPQFNSSLEPGGENLILKKYFNIGIAVETPNGLVVPVVRNADTKSVAEIASEMGALAAKARESKLTMADMSGACFTISSLGGIGGTGFTPIVNAPEVAILGVSRSKMQPVWNGTDFEPGMILPLSLSYDHRVIDGAEAARFTRQVAAVLEDVRRLAV